MSKHPKIADLNAPYTENVKSFFVTEFEVYKAIMSFPNGSEAGLDKIVRKFFEDLDSNSNGNARFNFLKSLSKLLNLISEDKVPEQ